MMKKRGEFTKLKNLLVILIFASMVILNSSVANAPAGCCVAPEYSDLVCVDVNSLEECCRAEGSWSGWSFCNETYSEGESCDVNQYCSQGYGCCITQDSCYDVSYWIECTLLGGNFIEEVVCSSQPQCNSGCCIYESEGLTFCDPMKSIACSNYDNYTFNISIPDYQCYDAYCWGITVGGYGNITGYIFNGSSEFPLKDASVEAGSVSNTTDNAGYYELVNAPQGYTTIKASRSGFGTKYEPVIVLLDGTVQKNITLMATGNAVIKGNVFVYGTQNAISGAWVILNELGLTDSTDTNGFYEFGVTAPGSYTLTAGKDHYSTVTSNTINVVEGDTYTQPIYLTPTLASNITGFVKYSNGTTVETGVTVKIEGTMISVSTDASGYYNFDNLVSGLYIVYAEKSGYNSEQITVSLPSGAVVNVNISLSEQVSDTCANLNGYCCGVDYTCGGTAYSTDDCTVCCDVECTEIAPNQDGDLYTDAEEPKCKWEEQLYDDGGYAANESWADGTCSDGIDNDCDSTGFISTFPTLIANNEDELDSDCGFCPAERCDYTNNRWCNETKSKKILSEYWVDFGGATDEYCTLCYGDFDCLSECQQQGYSCCQQCEGGSDAKLDYVCDNSLFCCDQCTIELTYYCCEYNWSCNAIASDQSPCQADETACLEECRIPFCVPGYFINDSFININPEENLLQNNTVCLCNGSRDTSWNGTDMDPSRADSGICCSTLEGLSYQETGPCPPPPEIGHVRGYVKDIYGNGINNAIVEIAHKSYTTHFGGYASSYGYYIITNVPLGQYLATISKSGYITNQTTVNINIKYDDGGYYNEFNFTLTGSSCCDEEQPSCSLGFTATPVQGKNSLMLSWTNPCPNGVIEGFSIDRTPNEITSNFYSDITSFEDTGLDWNTVYEYTLEAKYKDIGKGPRYGYDYASGNPGDILCKERELDWEFCVNNSYGTTGRLTKGVYCDNENIVKDALYCTEIFGTDYVCVELSGTVPRQTDCRESILCRDQTQGEPFGLYYTLENCIANDNYCYYDYSSTTVNACYSCSTDLSCFDYISEGACNRDNCGAYAHQASYQNCSWYNTTYYEEFSEGICYKPYYDGTEYCNRCNKSANAPFENPVCDYNACSRLGACYSEDNGDYCGECSGVTECEFYDDEMSCIGIDKYNFSSKHSFTIPFFASGINESYDYFDYSLDACNLKRCKWGVPGTEIEARCFKDGDGNNEPDCGTRDILNDVNCRKDHESATARIINIPKQYINSEGYTLVFEITGLGEKIPGNNFNDNIEIKYCLNKSNTCIPDHDIPRSTLVNISEEDWLINLTLPNDDYDNDTIPQNFTYVRFFSKDLYLNTEEIKSEGIHIDTIKPTVNITWARINDTDDKKSILLINVSTDTPANCSNDKLENLITHATYGPGIEAGFNASFETNYSGLIDGFHEYKVTCTDVYGNKKTAIEIIKIDRLQVIYDEFPDTIIGTLEDDEERLNNIFTESIITFSLKTPGAVGEDVVCKFYDDYTSGWITLTNKEFGSEDDNREYWKHNRTYPISIDGTFFFNVECNNSITHELIDTTSFWFTIDSIAPETSLYYTDESGTYPFNPNGVYTSDVEFTLSCYDSNLSAPSNLSLPGEARCNETFWCNSTTSCSPYEEYDDALMFDNTTTFCYQSTDYKRNIETVKCVNINIDDNGPEIIIEYPPNIFITNENPSEGHPINGTWIDSNGLDEIIVLVESVYTNLNIGPNNFSGHFSRLIEGKNEVKVVGTDKAGNEGSSETINVYYDKVGPFFINAKIQNTTDEVDNDTCTDCYIEWGQDIIISAVINDSEWTYLETQNNEIIINIDSLEAPKTYLLETTDSIHFNKTIYFTSSGLPGSYNEPEGIWVVTYTAEDKFGNERTKQQWFYVNDTTAPTFTIEILDNNEKTDVMVRNKDYTINVVSSEPLAVLPVLKYIPTNVNEDDVDFYAETVALPNVDEGMFNFTGTTRIPTKGIFNDLDDDGNNNSRWIIIGIDNHGNRGDTITPEEFIIDTKGPTQPKIENLDLDKTEYTNNSIFVAGYSRIGNDIHEPNQNVTLKLNNVTNNIGLPHNWRTIDSIISADQNDVVESEVLIFSVNSENSVTLNGSRDGSYIEFINHPRFNLKYYNITTITPSDYTYIEFEPLLEDTVTTANTVNLYNNPLPTGWFGFNLYQLTEGNNWIYVVAFDENSVEGRKSQDEVYNIIYDTTPPHNVVGSEYPRANRVTNNNKTNISVRISDSNNVNNISMINSSTINLIFGNISKNVSDKCESSYVTCSLVNDVSDEYLIVLDPSNFGFGDELLNGTYYVTVSAKDRAGNSLIYTWSFTIDPSVSDYPKYFVSGAYDSGYFSRDERGTRYTNDTTPKIIANFTANVSIESYGLSLNSIPKDINISTINYNFTFNFTIEVLSDGEYLFELGAKKIFNKTFGRLLLDDFNLVVDTTAPKIDNLIVNDGANIEAGNNFIIKADITEKSPNATVEYKIKNESNNIIISGTKTILEIQKDSPYSYTEEIALGYGNYTLVLKATDTFGKVNTSNVKFFINDTTAPKITPREPFLTNNPYVTISANLADASGIDWNNIVMRIYRVPLTNNASLSGNIVTYDLSNVYYKGNLTYNINTSNLVYVPSIDLLYPKAEVRILNISVSAGDHYGNNNFTDWNVIIDNRVLSSPLATLDDLRLEITQGMSNYVNNVSVSNLTIPLIIEYISSTDPELSSLSYEFSDPSKRSSLQPVDVENKIISLELTGLEETEYWIKIHSETLSGNKATHKFVFKVDRTKPTFTISTNGVTYASTGTLQITIDSSETLPRIDVTVTQNNSNPVNVQMRGDGTTWNGNYTVTSNNDGIAVINVSGTDVANNNGTNSTTFIVDTEAPFVNLDPIQTPRNTALINITGTTDGITAKLYVNDSYVKDVNVTNNAFSTDYNMTQQGLYKRIEIFAFDLANNNNSAHKMVIYDNTTPQIESITPANLSLHASVTDILAVLNDSISGINFSASTITLSKGTPISGNLTNSMNYITFTPYATLQDGDYNVTVTAVDNAGNNLSQTTTFTINSVPPNIVINQPSLPITYVNYGTFTTNGTITTNGTKTITSAYLNHDGNITNLLSYMTGDDFSYNITFSDGENNLVYTATDSVGLPAEREKQIILDKAPPTITIDDIDTTVSENNTLIIGTFSDNYGIDAGSITIKNNANNEIKTATLYGSRFYETISLDEGNNVINATIVDRAGNKNYDIITIIKDTSKPVINIISPVDGLNTTTQTITVSGTAISNYTTNGTLVEVFSNGKKGEDTTSLDGAFSISFNLNKGTNTITIIAKNAADQFDDESLTVKYDIEGPVITPLGPLRTNNLRQTISANLDDYLGIDWRTIVMEIEGVELTNSPLISGDIVTYDLSGVYYKGSLTYNITSGDLLYQPSINLADSGVETTLDIDVNASDILGNDNLESWEITIDDRIPSIPTAKLAELPLTATLSGMDDVVNNVSVSDSTIDLIIEFENDPHVFDELNYTFSSPAKIISVNEVDETTKRIDLTLTGLQQQQYWIKVYAETNLGNSDTFKFIFDVDRTNSSFTISTNGVTYTSIGTLQITVDSSETLPRIDVTVTQNNSNPVNVQMTGNGTTWNGNYTVTSNNDGIAVINVSGTDYAGNTGTNSSIFIVDIIEPFVNLDSIQTPTNVRTIIISGTTDGTAAKLHVDDSYVKDVNVTNNAFSTEYNMIQEGLYRIEIFAFDLVENNDSAFQLVAYDVTKPIIVSLNPANSTIHSSVTKIIAELYDTLVGVDFNNSTITLSSGTPIGGTLITSGNYLIFTPNITLEDGNYYVTVTAVDNAGNSLPQTTTFTINSVQPNIVINQPSLPITYVNYEAFTTSGTITGNSGKNITSAYLDHDGTIINLLKYMSVNYFSYNIALIEDVNNLVYTATDSVSSPTERTKQIILDKAPPTITIDDIDTTVSENNTLIIGTFSDNYGIDAGSITIKNNANGQTVSAILVGSIFYETISLEEGINVINSTIIDRAGNKNHDTITIIKDTGKPAITIISPSDGLKTNTREITVSGTAISNHTTDRTLVDILLNGNLQETIRTGTDGLFSFTINLLEGINTITVKAKNAAEQTNQKSITIEYDVDGPKITLIKPELLNYFNAFTSLASNIPIEIQTDENASCTIQKRAGGDLESFSTTDNLIHNFVYGYSLNEREYLFNITCLDNFNNPTTEILHLFVDLTDPFVNSVNANPNPVLLQTDPLGNFTATVDEPVKCKYILEDNVTAHGYNMELWETTYDSDSKRNIFNIGKWFDSSVNYLRPHSHRFRTSDLKEGLNGNYKYYVICEDRAGRLSSNNATIDLEVNFDWELYITDKGPTGTIHDKTPELSVQTNLNADCTARRGISQSQLSSVLIGTNPNQGPYLHKIQLPLNEENDYQHGVTYTYIVECVSVDNPAKVTSTTVSFTTDYILAQPAIGLISPSNGSTVTSSPIDIAGNITSLVEITSANLTVNDYLFQDLYESNNGTLFFNESASLNEGLNSFTIMATTDLSTTPADETYFVTLDTTGPEGEIEIGG